MSNAVTLNPAMPNPTLSGTIATYGDIGTFTIDGSSEALVAAVFGPATADFSIVNTGEIEVPHGGQSSSTFGIVLASTGSVRNEGVISGGDGGGVALLGTAESGYVVNTGTITGRYAVFSEGSAIVTNFDTGDIDGQQAGIKIVGGGYVSNFGGVISGFSNGIFAGALLHVVNTDAGDISGQTAINLAGGGYVSNDGGVISGEFYAILASGPVHVTNTGLIEGDNDAGSGIGVEIDFGGTVVNQSGGTIRGNFTALDVAAGNVRNAGLIEALGAPRDQDVGVILVNGTLVNQAGGTIMGGTAVDIGGNGVLDNSGTIAGTAAYPIGVEITTYNDTANAQSTIVNTGSIAGISVDGQADLETVIKNRTAGRITGGISTFRGPLDLINNGYISGVTAVVGYGNFQNNGTISASGTGTGIVITNGGTILDTGLIIGAGGTAISFTPSFSNVLDLTPGAKIRGEIDLDGTLNLYAGHKTGKLDGTSLQNIEALNIAKSASWNLSGSLTAPAITNDGTLHETGTLTIDGKLSGNGTIILGPSPLTLNAAVAAAQNLRFSGTGETLALGDAAKFAGTIQNFAPAETIDLTGISLSAIRGLHFAGGHLTIAATATYILDFANPATFTSETFTAFAEGPGTGITLASAASSIATPATGWLAQDVNNRKPMSFLAITL